MADKGTNYKATLFQNSDDTTTLKPYEEVCLVSKLPQFIHLILKNLNEEDLKIF